MAPGYPYPGVGLHAYLSMVRVPCERAAAAALAWGVASQLRAQAVVLGGVAAAALLGGLWVVPRALAVPGVPRGLLAIAVAFNILVAALVAYMGFRAYRASLALRKAARAIAEGRLSRGDYCDRSLLEVAYRAGARPP